METSLGDNENWSSKTENPLSLNHSMYPLKINPFYLLVYKFSKGKYIWMFLLFVKRLIAQKYMKSCFSGNRNKILSMSPARTGLMTLLEVQN